jgi:predicted CopG family antitoxin
MFTLTVHDQAVYERLLERAARRNESIDDVLRELLDETQPEEMVEAELTEGEGETPMKKFLRLIDEADLHFEHELNARDAEAFLANEMGKIDWRETAEDHGSP